MALVTDITVVGRGLEIGKETNERPPVIANPSGTRRPFKGPQHSDQVVFGCPVFCCNVWKC